MAELEASRQQHEAAERGARQEEARERWALERNEWFRMFVRSFTPSPDSENEDQSEIEPWAAPEWKELNDNCNDVVRYDIVWTIS